MKTVAHTESYVHELVTRAHLRPALGSVVRTLIGGITATGSVMLSEVLRPQVDKDALHAAEQRTSQALKNAAPLDTLPDVYLAMVAPTVHSLRFRSLDGSDLSKPAGRKFEHLDVVRDGSAPPRDRVVVGSTGVQPSVPRPPSPPQEPPARTREERTRTGPRKATPSTRRVLRPRTVARAEAQKERKADRKAKRKDPPRADLPAETKPDRVKIPSPPALKKLGYWMVQIEAGDGTGNHVPLFQDLFSTQDPAYQALGEDAWTLTYQQAMKRVLHHVGREGIWLMDRGFDAVVWMVWLHEVVDQNVLRLKKDRRVRLGTREAEPKAVGDLAQTLEARHTTQIRYVDKSTHEKKERTIPFAWAPIWIDGVPHPLYVLVGHTGRKSPLLLVTDRRPDGPKEAGELIQAYLERWGNEEVTRACKQLTGLERIRVRSMQAMRRLVWLAMIAMGIQALLILRHPRLRRATLDRAKEFIDEVRFVLYRIWRVVKEDLRDALRQRPHLFT